MRRATLIPSVTIPVSLLCTCAVMYLVGYTIDNVSLMALTIAVGFIIDDARRHGREHHPPYRSRRRRPLEAALVGSREIGFTIVSMTLSLIAVFIPLLLMGGLIGRLFREFAVTVSVAILMSGVVSLTLTPMMCSWLLRPARPASGRRGSPHGSRQGSTARLRFYAAGLRWSLRSSARHAGHDGGDPGRDRLPLPRHSQRFLPAAGQRASSSAAPRRRRTSRMPPWSSA